MIFCEIICQFKLILPSHLQNIPLYGAQMKFQHDQFTERQLLLRVTSFSVNRESKTTVKIDFNFDSF